MGTIFKYQGPWKGEDVSLPPNMIDPAALAVCENFILRAGEIRTFPRLSPFSTGFPNLNEYIIGTATFVDQNGVFHTCAFTQFSMYQLNPNYLLNVGSAWLKIGDYLLTGPLVPTCSAVFIDQVFFVNGTPNLYSWNGQVNAVTVQVAGYGAFFIAELASQLLLLNTVENNTYSGNVTQNYSQRVRWSPSGIVTTFDPAVNIGAGFEDLLDVPDAISNFFAIGSSGYLFRQNGISIMTPTGNGQAPFQFDHLWASKKGIGNVYPWAAAQYGSTGIIVSSEQMYELTIGGFQSVGGGIVNKFMEDAPQATSTIIGSIIPKLSMTYRFPAYVCLIPRYPDTIMYTLAIEDKSWVRRVIKNFTPLAPIEYIYNS